MEYTPYYGRWEYALGQIEGIVLHYHPSSMVRVSELPEQTVRFEVEKAPALPLEAAASNGPSLE